MGMFCFSVVRGDEGQSEWIHEITRNWHDSSELRIPNEGVATECHPYKSGLAHEKINEQGASGFPPGPANGLSLMHSSFRQHSFPPTAPGS